MRKLLWIAAVVLSVLTACNYDEGQCWIDGEGAGSVGAGGGGPIVPGSGGFGDVPPEPQDTTDSPSVDCNPEEQPDKEDDKGDASNSCGDIGTVAKGETYGYCSGPCEAKCLASGVNGGFAPAVFKFSTVVPDDGTGEAGGWQAATAALNIVRWTSLIPEYWTCTVKVGMPLRTAVHGKLSAATAATLAAGVATLAGSAVKKIEPPLPQGIFCAKLKDEMRRILEKQLTSYGAKMETP